MTAPLSDHDNALLRSWRRGELDRAQAQEFERRFFFEPQLLDAARADLAIAHGLRNADGERGERRRWAEPWWRQALAAGLGALAVLPFAWREDTSPALSANVEWVSIDVRRGDGEFPPLLVQPRAATRLVALEVALPEATPGPLALRLRSIGGSERVLDVHDVHVSDGAISLAFARDALPAGIYRIEIRRVGEEQLLSVNPPTFRYAPH